jgi:hypothetical protein
MVQPNSSASFDTAAKDCLGSAGFRHPSSAKAAAVGVATRRAIIANIFCMSCSSVQVVDAKAYAAKLTRC